MSDTRVEVRPKGQPGFYFEILMPGAVGAGVFPRVGERVRFPDGYGVVDSVTWEPPAVGPNGGKGVDMLIVVECVPEAERIAPEATR
jgi:hypothetical protein